VPFIPTKDPFYPKDGKVLIYLSVYIYIFYVCLSIYLFIYLSTFLSIYYLFYRLFITQHYVAFSGWPEARVLLSFSDISTITREKTLYYVPNAISIITNDKNEYFYASFLDREQCFNMLNNLLQVNRRLLELNGIDVNQTNRNLEFGYQVKNNIFGLTINGNNNSSSLSASTTSSSLLLSSSTHGNHSNINENSIHSDTIVVPSTTTTTTTTSISGSGSGGSSITPPASSRHVNSPTFTEQLGGSFKLMRSLSSIASHDPTISTTNATNNNITITASTAAAAAAANNNNNSNKNNDNVNADNVNDYNVTEANTAVNGGMNNGSISRNTIVIGITDKQNVVKSSETKSIISTTPTQAKDINSKETLRKTSMESSLTPTSTSPINALTTTVAESSPSSSSSSPSNKESIDSKNSLSTSIKKDTIEIPSNNDTNKQTIVKKKEMENKTTENDDSKPKAKQNVSFTTKPVFHNFNSIFQKASITILQTINYQIPSASLLWKSCWLHGENYR